MKKKIISIILGATILIGVSVVGGIWGINTYINSTTYKTKLVDEALVTLNKISGLSYDYNEKTEELTVTSYISTQAVDKASKSTAEYNEWLNLIDVTIEVNNGVKTYLENNNAGFVTVVSEINLEGTNVPVLTIEEGKITSDTVSMLRR